MADKFDNPDIGPELELIARNIVAGKKKLKRPTLDAHDLADALTSLTITDTTRGSSAMEIGVFDEDFRLLDEGFFDADDNGFLDPIDVNYPNGSIYHWRLTKVEYNEDSTATMSFMERAAVYLMHHHGPVKASRGKRTRAQFLKMLTDAVKADGGLNFHSHDLSVKQKQEKPPKEKTSKVTGKDKGISPDEIVNLKVGGVHANPRQAEQVEICFDVLDQLGASEKVFRAAYCAGVGESNWNNHTINSRGFGGVFQGAVRTPDHTNYWANNYDDTAAMTKSFALGGKGFQGGGAIALAKGDKYDVGEIALKVEVSGEAPSYYGRWNPEADDWLKAYGGASNAGGGTYRQQFNFQVGTTNKPHEDYWTAMQRLAGIVNWALFLDGPNVYYDPETTLIRQQPVAVIDRDDPGVVSWRATADSRDIASQVELELVCDPMEFRAGQVFKLNNFGPASSLSSLTKKHRLPGRWLIDEIETDRSKLTSSFTLKQPENPNREPAATQGHLKDTTAAAGEPIQGTPREIIERIVLPIAQSLGFTGVDPNTIEQKNLAHGPTGAGTTSDHQGPGTRAWAADMTDSTRPSPRMDKLMRALADRFDMPRIGLPHATSGHHPENIVSKIHGNYRFQLIYRTDGVERNHYNHVHFGVRNEKWSGPIQPTYPPLIKNFKDALPKK